MISHQDRYFTFIPVRSQRAIFFFFFFFTNITFTTKAQKFFIFTSNLGEGTFLTWLTILCTVSLFSLFVVCPFLLLLFRPFFSHVFLFPSKAPGDLGRTCCSNCPQWARSVALDETTLVRSSVRVCQIEWEREKEEKRKMKRVVYIFFYLLLVRLYVVLLSLTLSQFALASRSAMPSCSSPFESLVNSTKLPKSLQSKATFTLSLSLSLFLSPRNAQHDKRHHLFCLLLPPHQQHRNHV